MLNNFELQNILGSFYKSGHVKFHPFKNLLYTPVNNKIKVVDLENNTTFILYFQCQHNIQHIAIDPSGNIIIAVDQQGFAILYNLKGNFIISHFNFKGKIKSIIYSPDSKLLAIGQQNGFKIFEAPKFWRSFQPLILLKKYQSRHTQKITSINFSPDSKFLITSGEENIIYLNNVLPIPDYIALSFGVHKYKIIYTFFNQEMTYLYTVDKGGNIYAWKWVEDFKSQSYEKMILSKKRKVEIQYPDKVQHKLKNIVKQEQQQVITNNKNIESEDFSDFQKKINNGRFTLVKKLIFSQPASHVKRVEYLSQINMFASCHSNGKFSIWKLENQELIQVHTFSIGEYKINSLSINFSGSWIALAIKQIGQLIVWEWKSQTYIFNQSGLVFHTNCSTYSPDNNIIATGNIQGKVRLWDRKSGFCFSTFEEHEGNVTDVKFSNQTTLFSSSIDGTVNAYDVIKYKKFRVLKPDKKCQLICLAIQPSGEIICAGSFDPYEVYSWNLQTGNLLQIITGHTAPISTIQFANQKLITGSWDRTIRIYDFFSRKMNSEAIDQGSQITALAISPNKQEMAVSTLKGQIYLWKIENSQIIGIIDCRKDLKGGRKQTSKISAENDTSSKHLKTLKYSNCGEYLIGGGRSKYVLLYDIKHRLLLRRFLITNNKDIDGVIEKLNSKNIREGINVNEIQIQSESQDYEQNYLPGAKRYDVSKRSKKIEIQVNNIIISTSDKEFAVSTNFGLLIFAQTKKFLFSPYELSPNLTPNVVKQLFEKNEITSALIIALKLNIPIDKLLKKINIKYLNQILNQLNLEYSQLLLQKLSYDEIDERKLIWVQGLIKKVRRQKIPKSLISCFTKMEQINKIVHKNIALIGLSNKLKSIVQYD